MFFTLFLKECKQMLKGLTYYFVIIGLFLFYVSQSGEFTVINKPVQGQEDYGWTYSDDETVIMNETIKNLAREYVFNNYTAYPYGFMKKIVMNDKKQGKIGEILSRVTGMKKEELDTKLQNYYNNEDADANQSAVQNNSTSSDTTIQVSPNTIIEELDLRVASDMTYKQFSEQMAKVNKLIGGGSDYAKDHLGKNAGMPMTYEQALEQYNDIIEKDHYSGAYARYFCDYLGIMLALLPVFIAVTRGLRDKRARASEIIYSKQASSFQIVMSRYFAMVIMILIPVLVLSLDLTIQCISVGSNKGITIDYLAFAKYILGWLVPTIMMTISIGAFLTELTDTAIAIIIQGFWWFLSLMTGNLVGNCGWNLIPRHNALEYYSVFKDNFGQLVVNRITYTIAAIVLLFATVAIYEMKRKGRLNIHGKIFSNRKNKSEA